MALRTRSTGARAAIAASRISQSERERLQLAVDNIEASIKRYNKEKKSRSGKAKKWGSWKKLSKKEWKFLRAPHHRLKDDIVKKHGQRPLVIVETPILGRTIGNSFPSAFSSIHI